MSTTKLVTYEQLMILNYGISKLENLKFYLRSLCHAHPQAVIHLFISSREQLTFLRSSWTWVRKLQRKP